MSEIIHARNIVKRYGTFTAVDGISFSVRAGECFGFLGPNGAGKTTTIRMITCVSPVTGGELTVAGMALRRHPDRVASLSSGMQRRLTIARGLINSPRILVLDEPTTGLDPQARHMVWQKLRQLRSQGVTMLLTTHYMEEAAHLCDRRVIIFQGKIIAEETPAALKLEASKVVYRRPNLEDVFLRLTGRGLQE